MNHINYTFILILISWCRDSTTLLPLARLMYPRDNILLRSYLQIVNIDSPSLLTRFQIPHRPLPPAFYQTTNPVGPPLSLLIPQYQVYPQDSSIFARKSRVFSWRTENTRKYTWTRKLMAWFPPWIQPKHQKVDVTEFRERWSSKRSVSA